MLKKDLVKELHGMFPEYLKEDIADVVDIIFEAMALALEQGRRIEIRGFGSFALHDQKEKVFRNPKTGKTVVCPGNKRIVFKAGKRLRNIPVEHEETQGGSCAVNTG
jgi:integration host factor subunit beta